MGNDTDRNEAVITYFGEPMKVACDRRCDKAWGGNHRPRVQLSESVDDFAYLADDELGEAPADPGTYEGGETKPESPDEFPNKWCVRECERCASSAPGQWRMPLPLTAFDKRVYNKPQN
ncbi:MAG: hypothetical protein HY289_04520 [Planctomycetes bacterium]|nr:hypothetical protein [Planctomycetota bacterium]